VTEHTAGTDARTGDPVPVAGGWRTATVLAIRAETERTSTFRLDLGMPSHHLAGQHYVVRLTAEDGYTAARSYSIASAPDGSSEIELTVERLDDGEVSTFLHDELQVGDELEVRGPIGGWFVWAADTPALLIGGGSGVVPLMAMLRLARREGRADLVRFVVSVRSPADLFYPDELPGPETKIVYTRLPPPGDARGAGRLTSADIATSVLPDATVYICGSADFADAMSDRCAELGIAPGRLRIERFGSTGPADE
jgi:ferredoxin-NADP reductase